MSVNFEVVKGELTTLNVEIAAINDGWILLNDGSIRHNSTKTTRISKQYLNKFVIGSNYKIEFTIANYISCDLTIIVRDNEEIFTSNGVKEFFFIANSVNETITFESNGFLDITNITISEIVPNVQKLEYTDEEYFENKSFTVSYDLINNKWISYHEYLPNNYIRHNTDFLIYDKSNTMIKKSYSNNNYLKGILEIVSNEYPMTTKVLDSITVNAETYTVNEEKINDFFNKLIVYDEIQSSGEIELNSNNLTKKEKNWNFNKLLDISKGQSNVKLFTEDWEDIKNNYFIDKVVNTDSLDLTKPWFKRGRFRDKYFIIRFFYDNLENNKILVNFVNTQYRISQR